MKRVALRQAGAVGQGAARPDRALVQMRQELRADDSAKRQISRCAEGGDSNAEGDPAMLDGPAHIRSDNERVRKAITGLRHSRTPLRKNTLERTGAMRMEKVSAPSRAKATVRAMGLNSRPSTRCSVKIGM